MGQLWIKETHVNTTEGYQYYQGNWYEAQQKTIGELFRDLRKEFGRAESKMYRDQKDGPPVQIGWVFGKAVEYEGRGPKEKYHRAVWVEVSMVEPMKKTIWLPAPVSPWGGGGRRIRQMATGKCYRCGMDGTGKGKGGVRLICRSCGVTGTERTGQFKALTASGLRGNVVALQCVACGGMYLQRVVPNGQKEI